MASFNITRLNTLPKAAASLAATRAAGVAGAGRAFSASASSLSSDPFARPGPPPLPPKEQREFEKLVRDKANSLQFNAASKPEKDGEESLHPDMRRKPAPDFDGDTNPVTDLRRSSFFGQAILSQVAPAQLHVPQLRTFSTSTRRAGAKDENSRASARSQSTAKDQPPSKASDPFPLPFDPSLASSSIEGSPPPDLASSTQLDGLPQYVFDSSEHDGPEVYSPMTRVPGRTPSTEDRQRTIARLIYQVRKRGTLETDLLLSTFAKTELPSLSMDELAEFDRLLDEPDWDIFYWATERKPVPARWAASFETQGRLGWRLRKHTKNEEKVPRRMPTLE